MMTIKQYWTNFRVWLYMTYHLPQSWNDMSLFQLKLMGRLLYTDSNLEKKFFRTLLIVILVLKKPTAKYIFKAIYLLRSVPSSELLEYSNFIFNPNESLTHFIPVIKVRPRYKNTKLPSLKKVALHGPGKRLQNITIDELSYADAFYFNWIKDNKTQDLQRLVACLYRPASGSPSPDDIRQEFNRLLLPDNARLTDRIPVHIQYVIALAYQGSREKLFSRFPNVFPKAKATDNEKPTAKKPVAYQPFSKIVNAMAMDEVQVFGNLQQTEKTNAVKFLEIYEETIIQSRKNQK